MSNKHKFNSGSDFITMKAAYGHLLNEGAVDCSGYVKLSDLKSLLVKKETKKAQNWSYIGDWKKVLPYWEGKYATQ